MTTGVPLVDTGAIITCAHGAPAMALAPCDRVKAGGQSVITITSSFRVSGCEADSPTGQSRCLTGAFNGGAARVAAEGAPVVLESSTSTCEPSGSAMIVATVHSRVKAV